MRQGCVRADGRKGIQDPDGAKTIFEETGELIGPACLPV